MFKKFSQWIAIALIVLLVFVGLVPQSASANPVETEGSNRGSLIDDICNSLNQGLPISDQYHDYYLKQNSISQIPSNGSIKATFYGTTMLLLDDGATQILIDAHLTRPSCNILITSYLLYPKYQIKTNRDVVDQWLNRSEVGKPEAIFIAHSHHDHALDTGYIAKETGATLYGSESTANIARGKCRSGSFFWGKPCVSEENIRLYEDLKQPVEIGEFTVTVLQGTHSPITPGFPEDIGIAIDKPLSQPARTVDYTEGGSYSFLIEHGEHSIMLNLAQPEADVLEDIQADVLFLATPAIKGTQENQDADDQFYNVAVGMVNPDLVIPVHWDNFMLPLNQDLVPFAVDSQTNDNPNHALEDTFDFLINKLEADNIQFGIMQGYQSVMLFED